MKATICKLLLILNLFPFAVLGQTGVEMRIKRVEIALDENINNKLQTWKLPDNEFPARKKVTLANLLSHPGPLNMTNSTYSQPLPDDWRPKAASGHRSDGALVAGKIHVYPEMAAAGNTNATAMLKKLNGGSQ